MEEISPFPSLKYEKAVKNLFKKVNNASTLAKVRNLFNEFSQKYTVIELVWRKWFRAELTEDYKDYNEDQVLSRIEKIKKEAQKHFYCWTYLGFDFTEFTEGHFGRTFLWYFLNSFSISTNFDQMKAEAVFQALVYPNNKLKDFYSFAKKHSNYPIPKEIQQKYKKTRQEYNKIGVLLPFYSNYDDDKKLFINGLKNYANFGEKSIVIENFECAIGLFSCNTDLWEMYFNYLKKQKGGKRLLNLYSRYCRLFIENLVKQNEYCNELERRSMAGENVSKWWIDVIEIVKDSVNINAGREVLERALKCSSHEEIIIKYGIWFEKEYGTMEQYMTRHLWSIKIHPKSKNLHNITRNVPNLRTPIKFYHKINYIIIDKPKKYIGATFIPKTITPSKSQSFPFRPGIMSYIEKTANHTVAMKLFMSAKYFFLLKKSPYCYNLTIFLKDDEQDHLIFYPHSLFITPAYIDYSTPNFTITNGLFILCKNSSKLFSMIIPKLNFIIKHLILTNQILTLKDFNFIVELKLKSVKFDKVVVNKKNNDDEITTELSIDEIICMLDGVKDLSLLQITPNIPLQLHKIQRIINLKVFEISMLNEHFNFNEFIDFAKKNIRNNAKIILHFIETVTKEQKKIGFDQIMQTEFPNIKFYNK